MIRGCSTSRRHQFPFYPGTGAADEAGMGAGAGFTFNVPLEAGATDADYDLVYRDAVVPVIRQFAPQLVLVSAGFDAHESDPLASMRMTASGYGTIVRRLMEVAPDRKMALVSEGGYDLTALAVMHRRNLRGRHRGRRGPAVGQ